MSGIEVLEALKKADPEMVVMMITAFASVETAITAMKIGAFDYITKPFKNDEVLAVVANGAHQRHLVTENRTLKQALSSQQRYDVLVGKAPKMQEVYALIQQVAPSRSTVLISGESGTGKELAAKAIHNNSTRQRKGFRHCELGEPTARSAREQSVRAPQRSLHWSGQPQEGPLRGR